MKGYYLLVLDFFVQSKELTIIYFVICFLLFLTLQVRKDIVTLFGGPRTKWLRTAAVNSSLYHLCYFIQGSWLSEATRLAHL